jgi:ribonuclease D
MTSLQPKAASPTVAPPTVVPVPTISKEEINKLRLSHYEGRVEVVSSVEGIKPAVQALRTNTVLGFDTETRPSFRKNESYPPALVQLAGAEVVFLFQLQRLSNLTDLWALLGDERIVKAGVAIERDLRELQAVYASFLPAGFAELSTMADDLGITNNGLRGLTAVCLGVRISKRAQTSNWAREQLDNDQITYAATDAWASREIYLDLVRRRVVAGTSAP